MQLDAVESSKCSKSSKRSPQAAVLFDMDGVLVLSNPAHLEAWQLFAREKLGVEITAEMFFRSISGRKNEEALAELFPGRFSKEELARVGAEKEAFYRERFAPHLPPVPGVLELIHELSSPPLSELVALALVTSGPSENARFIIGRFQLEEAFAAVVTGADVARAKPDPTIYLMAAERLGVPPARCIVLEDACAGVQAAKRAGMRCLAVATSEPPAKLTAAGADLVRPDFRGVSWALLQSLL